MGLTSAGQPLCPCLHRCCCQSPRSRDWCLSRDWAHLDSCCTAVYASDDAQAPVDTNQGRSHLLLVACKRHVAFSKLYRETGRKLTGHLQLSFGVQSVIPLPSHPQCTLHLLDKHAPLPPLVLLVRGPQVIRYRFNIC